MAKLDFQLRATTWLYPIQKVRQLKDIQGFIYFASHRFLWPSFRSRLLPIALLSAFIYANLFIFAYLPQVAFLAIFHRAAGAWINGAFLVLGEGAAIVALLFEAFFVDEILVDVFDAVFLSRALERSAPAVSDDNVHSGPSSDYQNHVISLLSQARTLHFPPSDPTSAAGTPCDPLKCLGKPLKSAVYAPFSLRQIAEFIILLPLNLVPVAGTPLFLALTGYRAGPFHHWRYFQLREFSKKDRKAFISRRILRYMWFGTVALLLQLVPLLSMFFLLTTAAGSALWASDMEFRRWQAVGGEGSNSQDRPQNDYQDDPTEARTLGSLEEYKYDHCQQQSAERPV
ncbi:hypothetical protein FQN57_004311 [Myotisia sp. PD_48]|nr:hypothetical protein FQN57_004311 [Myotisia sp. PD_48]